MAEIFHLKEPVKVLLVLSKKAIKRILARQISRLLKQTAQEAGITKPVTLRTLQHSFAPHLLERSVDIRVIQALLGHTKLTATARYASVTTGTIAAVDSPLDDLNATKRKKGKPKPSLADMSGPLLEVAGIFRAHGAARRAVNAGHISLTQLKVMSAAVRVLSRLYRRFILEGLTRLHKTGRLRFFGDTDRDAFDTFLTPLCKIDWVVYAKEPFAGPKPLLAYLSRYTHSVTFRVIDYRLKGAGRHTTMTLGV